MGPHGYRPLCQQGTYRYCVREARNYWQVPDVYKRQNIYRMNEFEDYYYGYMVPDSGYLKNFALHLYDEGFVLQMPLRKEPDVVPAFEPREKLFQVLKSSVQWGDLQNIETVGALNDMVTKYDMRCLLYTSRCV